MTKGSQPASAQRTTKQRLVFASVGLAGSLSLSTAAAIAHESMPLLVHAPQASTSWATNGHMGGFAQHGATSQMQHTGQNLLHTAGPNSWSNADSKQTTVGGFHSFFHAHNAAQLNSLNAPQGGGNNVNLGSTKQDFFASNLTDFHTITIDVGGVKETINLQSKLTAAEYVAAQQVLTSGVQTINISKTGAATGGTVVLDNSFVSAFNGSIGSLTVSHGVKLIDEVSTFALTGVLYNRGSILTAATAAGASDTISANHIVNGYGGAIGSYTGSDISGLFAADPILNAAASVVNSGKISSSGNLTISAPEIQNLASPHQTATITANQNVNLNTAHLVNSGTIASKLGNVNVGSDTSLLVENSGGTISAVHGNINMQSNNDALTVMAGNYDSQQLNLKAGQSAVNLQAEKVSGLINASGNNVHLYTSNSDLNLGDVDADGDPTIASQNNIIIDGTIAPTNGANLAIVSGKNIVSASGGVLDTRSTAPGGGNGGNLSLIAGANFTVDGSGNVVLTDSAGPNKGSATGGVIDFTGVMGPTGATGPISLITTAGTGATGNAGYVQMVAYAGTGILSGSVFLPTGASAVTVDAGSAGGQRGDVSLIAGSQGPGYTTAGITGRNISLSTFTPSVGTGMTFDTTGTASKGINSFVNSGTVKFSQGQTLGNISATGDININVGSVAITGNIAANGDGGIAGGASLNGGNGHNIDITGNQRVTITGNISAVGGGGAGSGSSTPTANGGDGGAGGQVTIVKNGPGGLGVTVSGDINVSGGGGGGGAGGSETTAATGGGTGGLAGGIKINSLGGFSMTGTAYAYDGGAGGTGGFAATGVGAGGGGGSAYGGGGGGGGGGTGTSATDYGAGGGGGFSALSGSGGGGGGVFGSTSIGTLSTGGNGGGASGNGTGGLGDTVGGAGLGSAGGNGGGIVGAAGGAGGSSTTVGGKGGETNISGQGSGFAGGTAKVVTGHGLLDISANGIGATGSAPLLFETGTLKLSSNAAPQGTSFNLQDNAGVPLNVLSINTSNLNLTTSQRAGTTGADGTVNLVGTVSGTAVSIITNGDAGPNDINISAPVSGGFGPNAGPLTLISNGGTVTTTGSGLLTAIFGSISANGDINVKTNMGNSTAGNGPGFNFTSKTGNVTIDQGSNFLPLVATVSSGKSITVTAQNTITAIRVSAPEGTINFTTTGGNFGVVLRGPVSTGTTSGSITMTTSGTGSITNFPAATGTIVTSNSINFATAGSIGSVSSPILTTAANSGTITSTTAANGNIYLVDSATGSVSISAASTSSGTFSLVSQASALTIPQANYTTVSITAPNAAVTVGTSTATTLNASVGSGLSFVDTTTSPLVVNGPLAANSVTIQAKNASGVTVNGSLGNSSATLVDIESGGGIALSSGSTVTAATINLASATNNVTFGSFLSSTSVNLATNAGAVSIAPSATPGGTDQIAAGGDLTILGTFISTNPLNVTVNGNLTIGSAIVPSAGLTGSSLTLSGQSVTNYGTLSSGSSLAFLTPSVTNLGTASAQTSLSFSNPTGALSVSGNQDSFTTAAGAALSFVSGGDTTITSPSGTPFAGLSQLGSFNVNAGGKFTTPLTGVTLLPDGSGNGGTISLVAADVVYNGTGTAPAPFVLSANGGSAAGNKGGIVTLNITGNSGGTLVIGNAAGNFSISAAGSDGGQVNVTSAGNLTVNTASMQVNATSSTGNGSTVNLAAGNNLLLSGNLDTHNGSGTYGAITLSSGSTQTFNIDGTKTTTTNGQIGIASGQGISGSTVTITNPGGVTLAKNYVLYGPGGITINGSGLTNNGAVNTANLAINASGTGTLTTGVTGTYQSSPMTTLTLNSSTGGFNINGNVPSANVISISAANGTVAFGKDSKNLTAAPDGAGNGGSINVTANALTFTNLDLSAAGSTGAGGTIALNLSGTTTVNVGKNDLTLNVANAAGQAGGSVSISNGGTISIDAKYMNLGGSFAAGQGANLTLSAGNKLFVDHTTTLPTGLHNVTLQSGSTSAFQLGGAGSNGIGDNNKTLSADNITIVNTGGAIYAGSNKGLIASIVTLTAQGSIGKKNEEVILQTPTLVLSSATGDAYVNIKTVANTDFTATVAGTLSITAAGGINSDSLVSAAALILDANSINHDTQFTTNATSITAATKVGGFSIVDTQSAPITLGTLSADQYANILSDGNITTTKAITSNGGVSLASNNGSIVISDDISATASVSLLVFGSGSITDATKGGYTITANAITFLTNGGNVGSATIPLRTNTTSVNLSSNSGAGDYFIANSANSTTASLRVQGSSIGSLNLTDDNSKNNNSGTIIVDSLQATTGGISISSNERNFTVEPGQTITTFDGNITLQNTFAKQGSNLPLIHIGDGTTIHASSNGDVNTGNVYIVLGKVPATADLRPGVAPTGGSPTITGTVYFGTKQNPNGSITTDSGDVLTGSLRNLVFNTNQLAATQITLGQNVTIIADPPVAPGIAGPVLQSLQYAPAATHNAPSTATLSAPGAPVATPSGLTVVAASTTSPTISQALPSLLAASTSANAGGMTSTLLEQSTNAVDKGTRLSGGVANVVTKHLEKGAMLLSPEQDTLIESPFGTVAVAAHSVALLVSYDRGLAVYDLHDSHTGAVAIRSHGAQVCLSPGRSAVLTQAGGGFEEVNPVRTVGYRNLTNKTLGDNTKVYQGEFALLSVINGLKPFGEMAHSDNAKTRKTIDNVLKTAAILMQLDHSQNAFRCYAPKEVVALVSDGR
ncbi:MAG: hypothetical protein JSS86_01095 [Cyanobacteria bacterium SZAS LIN-2]|nr:hypothetical protein [Cyanobacteria bacterium SZAS LIN-3]MBS1994867.1 hypothetical protein [Cyanobacteria bacterium SZAS LIN-2]